ncbi:MAG: hypothetical protein JO313_17070 [Verrucomicrobia bacterium]|nr:hypothetical protein [Verrucomicrobiota bacterium]
MLNQCDLKLKSAQYRKALLRLIKACGAGHTGGGLSCLDILNRGSAKLAPFAKAAPGRIVEVGIAEQNPVGVAAAAAGKRVCAVTPASFLTAPSRSRFKIVGFPDEHTVTGSQEETFRQYGIDGPGLATIARSLLARA